MDDDLYDVEIFDGESLEELVYYSDGKDDATWLLSKMLEVCKSSNEAPYSSVEVYSKIEVDDPYSDTTLLCLGELERKPLFINNINKWKDAHRYYLHLCYDNEQFINRAKLCFENLFFHERVLDSLKTLSVPLCNEYNREIIMHLIALNDELPLIYKNYHHEGDQSMLDRLPVKASPERKPKVVAKQLTFKFENNSGFLEEVKCGPHTKLKGEFITASAEYLQDRIYFGWGKDNIQDGKILVAHIGKHRD
ncbi:hypothetical protein ABNX05_25745 [Lysinibacillus sp. M3]|uniref:Uncharacterized protein n=1 Tax=Lysinibacillus zambalensis TaxID=3160866 RepID=A0ABV1MZR4_9BACI